jgi:hypothetical protein
VGDEHLQGNQDGTEAQVGGHDQQRARPAESLDAGEDDALCSERIRGSTDQGARNETSLDGLENR